MDSREQRCAIYTRISDDRDGKEVGVKNQLDKCQELADSLGLAVYKVYSDNDIGASDKTSKKKIRIEYRQMLEDAENGLFQTVVSYSNSRITRRLLELEELIRLHERTEKKWGDGKGVRFRTLVSGNDDLSTPDGRMTARIKASVDSAEAERISERVKMFTKAKALEGLPGIQRRRPFGFEKDAITHRPDEAEAIREAVRDIIAGASITDIRKKWVKEGIKTTDGNNEWGWKPVHRVLFGWRTVGVRDLKGNPFDAKGNLVQAVWDPIVSTAERDAALLKLKERTRASERKGEWLLQGLLRCGLCGRTLYGALQKEGVDGLYTCTGSGTSHLSINAPTLEHYIENLILRYALEKALHGNPSVEPSAKVWPGEARQQQLEGLIEALMEAFSSGGIAPRDHFKQLGILTKERDALERDRVKFELQLLDRPNRVATIEEAQRWFMDRTALEFRDLRQLILNEIDFVVIGKGSKGYGGRTHEVVRQRKIWDRAELFWKEPHYTWNGIRTEDLLDLPIQFGGTLTDTEPDAMKSTG